MATFDKIRQLRLQKEDNSGEVKEKKGKDPSDYGGRKMILILFFLTIFLSFLFWFQGQFSEWLRSFFGPSTWMFSR